MNPLIWKIGGPLILLLLVLGLGKCAMSWRDKARTYDAEVVTIVDAVKLASNNPKLERRDVVHQVDLLGSSLRDVKAGAQACNASISQLLDTGAKQQREADARVKAAMGKVQAAESAQRRLEASARTALPGQCLSPEVRARWR